MYLLSVYTTDRREPDLVPALILAKSDSRDAIAEHLAAEIEGDLDCTSWWEPATLEIDGAQAKIRPTRRRKTDGSYGCWHYSIGKVDFSKGTCFVLNQPEGPHNDLPYQKVYTVHEI